MPGCQSNFGYLVVLELVLVLDLVLVLVLVLVLALVQNDPESLRV